jgi:chlorite dismutase
MTQTTESTQRDLEAPVSQQAVHFAFYKLGPEWLKLSPETRRDAGRELNELIERWSDRLLLVSYSLAGLRADCDLLLWKAAESIDDIQALGLEISASAIGPYLYPAYAYLSLTKRSVYTRNHPHPGEPADRSRIAPIGARYLFVYPFVKTRAWYGLAMAERQRLMDEHIRVGHKYPRVRLNTTYSFGLDDQEFVLAFETDYPSDFLDLVMELREVEASQYTQRDTPIFTCIKAEGVDLLRAIGASQ